MLRSFAGGGSCFVEGLGSFAQVQGIIAGGQFDPPIAEKRYEESKTFRCSVHLVMAVEELRYP